MNTYIIKRKLANMNRLMAVIVYAVIILMPVDSSKPSRHVPAAYLKILSDTFGEEFARKYTGYNSIESLENALEKSNIYSETKVVNENDIHEPLVDGDMKEVTNDGTSLAWDKKHSYANLKRTLDLKPATTKVDKTNDAILPSYCDPPNPCPVGYTAADGCIENFENTAQFSRKYQAAQKCMCDTDHMFNCPGKEVVYSDGNDIYAKEIVYRYQEKGKNFIKQHKYQKLHSNFMKNLAHSKNPYLEGEKLPIAAKKGYDLE